MQDKQHNLWIGLRVGDRLGFRKKETGDGVQVSGLSNWVDSV